MQCSYTTTYIFISLTYSFTSVYLPCWNLIIECRSLFPIGLSFVPSGSNASLFRKCTNYLFTMLCDRRIKQIINLIYCIFSRTGLVIDRI